MILELRPEWGSENPDHRRKIRDYLAQRFEAQAVHDLGDLSRLPELRDGFVSVSHCRGLGGFLVSPAWSGFDVELTDRVTPELAARIGDMEEFAQAPDPAALWCAKESAFKALRFARPPKVIMDLKILWLSDYLFALANGEEFGAESGQGWIERRGPHTLAGFHTSALNKTRAQAYSEHAHGTV